MADSQIQSDDKIKKLQGQVQDVTDVMERNIELGNILNNVMSTIGSFFGNNFIWDNLVISLEKLSIPYFGSIRSPDHYLSFGTW